MSQSHATDEFHSRHISTLVSDSVEQYMGHFQYNQNLLLDRLSNLEAKMSVQQLPKPSFATVPLPDEATSSKLGTCQLVTLCKQLIIVISIAYD